MDSQWYFVAELLNGKMSQCGEIDLSKIKADLERIIPVPRPQETVALGLVYSPLMEQIQFAAKSEPKSALNWSGMVFLKCNILKLNTISASVKSK